MDEENKYSEYTKGMSEAQAAEFIRMAQIYDQRFSSYGGYGGQEVDEDQAKDLTVLDYGDEINALLGNEQFNPLWEKANRRGMAQMLISSDIDPYSFFEDNPTATPIDVMRATNFENFNEKEALVSNPDNYTNVTGATEGKERLSNQYLSRFQNSFFFPELGKQLKEIVPDYIKEDPEKMQQFEFAFSQQLGGAKIDLDDSGRVGDYHTDNVISNFWYGTGYALNDAALSIEDGVLSLSNTIYDLFGGDLAEADKEFLERQEAGEEQTVTERVAAFEKSWWGAGMDDSLFWASFYSPEARRQYAMSRSPQRTLDWQTLEDRNISDADSEDIFLAGLDMITGSAGLMVDIMGGGAVAKGALKGLTKKIAKEGAEKASAVAAVKRGAGFASPTTGKFVSKEAAEQMSKKAVSIEKNIARLNGLVNTTGAVVATTPIVAAQMHADLVGEEWYDNLSPGEKLSFLGVQAGAEVVTGIALGRAVGRGLGKSRMTQNIIKGQGTLAGNYTKHVLRSTFAGLAEEALAEGATAGIQYLNEVRAKQLGGDMTAVVDWGEFWKKSASGALAGSLMGGLTGFSSGTIGGGVKGMLASSSKNLINATKERAAAEKAFNEAKTEAAKQQAAQRLEAAMLKHSGANTAMARAYQRMAEADPESFDEIARLQGFINAKVFQYNNSASNPEFQGAIRNEIKSLIERKQELEAQAAKAAGANSVEALYEEEAKKVASKRKGKVDNWKQSWESDPERETERQLKGELEAQKMSLYAAETANSAEQKADDSTQDKEGVAEDDIETDPDYQEQEGDVLGADANGLFDPAALEGTPLAGIYRDVVTKINNLSRAFKGLGVDVVLHTNINSFHKQTGEKGGGFFKDGNTIHVNLEGIARTRAEEAKDPDLVRSDTVRHEFLHAAFKTLTPQQKQQFLEELSSMHQLKGIAAQIKKRVEQEYSDYSEEKLIEEKVVSILEYVLDNQALDKGIIQRIIDSLTRLLGFEIFGESDLQGFVRKFRAAERTGARFEGEAVTDGTDMASREFGVRMPSKAYPDLVNKAVRFNYNWPDKFGRMQSYSSEKVFNDYWHFRNWWIRETGNGKRADNISSFQYKGADGTFKTINPPKPKIDKETGKPVDMTPNLKPPSLKKMEAGEVSSKSRERIGLRRQLDSGFGNALKIMAGLVTPTGYEVGNEMNFDSRMTRTEQPSDLPVVYSEVFFTEGLKSSDFEQLGRDFRESLDFIIPPSQEADLAFTFKNNGDGSITAEVKSNVLTGFGKENGDILTEGFAGRDLRIKDEKQRSLKPTWAKESMLGNVLETLGMYAMSFGFDRTFKYSGVKDLVLDDNMISSHVDIEKAAMILDRMVAAAIAVAEREGLGYGDVGRLVIYNTLLGEESTLGNPYVFKDAIKNFSSELELEKALNKNTSEAKQFQLALLKLAGSDAEVFKVAKTARKGEKVTIDDVVFNKIVNLISENASSFTFNSRTIIAKQILSKENQSKVIEKHNDKQLKKADLGEVVSYTIVPFSYTPGALDGDVKGFDIDLEPASSKKPFKGKIIATNVFDKNGKLVEKPKTLISTSRYHLAELMPETVIQVSEKGDKETIVKTSDLTPSEQRSKLNPRAAISAIEGFVQPTSFLDPDNRTIKITEKQRVGSASRNLGLKIDNSVDLPFEPNRINAFQAFMSNVDRLFANKYSNVFSLQKAVEAAKGRAVEITQDFINAETLMYGKTSNDLEKLDEKVKAISEEMKLNKLSSEDVSQYLIARHAPERNAVIADRTNGKTLDGSGMSNERAQEVMNSLSAEKRVALESIARKVDAITKDTRKTMVEFGLESQETIDAFEQMFSNYIPLGGLSADEMSADTSLYPTGGAGMNVYGDTTRRAMGRKSEANNVLAQAIAQNAAVHAKGRKNEALSSLYNLVESNPNPKVWNIVEEVPFDAKGAVGVRINGEQKFIMFTNPDLAKSLKNMGVEKLDLISKAMRRFSGFLRRSFTTANPEFIISNFARDIQSALFNAMAEADIPGGQIESKYIATKIIQRVKQTLPALLKGSIGKDMDPEMAAYFEEFKADGGQTGWGFVKDVATIAEEIESEVNEKSKAKKAREWAMKHSIDIVENVNDAFENSIRLAAYIEARKAGASRQKSAELAKNITVNFNRSGELGPMANAWYMFFNASVQGTVRLARSLGTLKDVRKPNGELESWHKRLNAAQKMAFGLSLMTGMLTMINMAMSDEDEDGVLFYKKIPDYEKERNLIIMYDGKNYLKIPLPYGFNIFANMGSSMAEVAGGQRDMTDAGMFLLNSAFSSFSPISFGQSEDAAKYVAKGVSPTILKPLVDIAVNESYFGSSVYKEQFPVGAPKPESEMSFRAPEGVRNFFQWINEATGGSEFVPGAVDFNPDKFWYGFEYYIGGAGQFVTRTLGTGRDLYETIKEGEKVPMKANDFPFLRKLYGEASKYYDSDVYVKNSNKVSQLYKERKEAENKGDARYAGIMKLEKLRKKTEKQLKNLRAARKEARNITNYVERQKRIHELYEKERSLLMEFNKQYELLRGED